MNSENTRLFRQAQMSAAEGERLYQASAELNMAQSYDDLLSVLRRHTIIGQNAQHINLNYFDQPWTNEQRPEWVIVLVRWTQIAEAKFSSRYRLPHYPSFADFMVQDEPTLIEDVDVDPRLDNDLRALYQGFKIKSALWVPLDVGARRVGFLNVGYVKQVRFPEMEVRLLTTLVGQAAVAVQNFYNLTMAAQRASELAVINEITQTVSQALEIEQVLETIYQQLRRVMAIDAFFLGLYDNQTGLISYPLVYDQEQRYDQKPVPLIPKGLIRQVIETGEPVLLNRTPEEVQTLTLTAERAMGDEQKPSASLIYVPLQLGGRVFGVMSAQSYAFDAYHEGNGQLLMDVASHIAVALENARLFEQTQARAEREQKVRAITDKIRQGVDAEAILRITAQEVSQMFGASKAIIRLGTQANLLLQHAWTDQAASATEAADDSRQED